MRAPFATVTKLSCVSCFMENDECRRRELQMHMVRLDHPVAHGKLRSAKEHVSGGSANAGVRAHTCSSLTRTHALTRTN